MRFAMLMIVGLVFSSSLLAEEKPDPRENLDTAIPEAIRLLEKKDYEGLLKSFVSPKELEMITADKPLADFAKGFGAEKADKLLTVLNAIKGTTPTLSEDKALATFELKEPVQGKRDIQFKKIDKYWYIKN